MKTLLLATAAILSTLATGALAAPAAPDERTDIISFDAGDAGMNAAIAEAKATFPDFLAAYRSGRFDAGDFVFKYPLGGFEHIWVRFDGIEGDVLLGRLANVPAQPDFRIGQAVRVPVADISDWAYRDDKGVIVGHRTTRVMLDMMDEETRRSTIDYMGW